ncbi:MAG TPA: Na/Pi cotransporter family protein [Bacillota bacterium]|jgi:phosphate:Na+ symporter|nr:Na/Pi cotransporter family protein [Bacillota bacterium]HPZ91698.1 Na/Pi cotransporter family protein [Bacillota bacterium]
MTIAPIAGLIGGLGLFLYGMTQMGNGLQRAAGDRLRVILKALTGKTWMGVLVGALVTAIIQSSSGTTVMLVSFVNAGLMTLTQATGVIMGANIGTTMTAQLIAFRLSDFALPAIGIGAILFMFSKRRTYRYFGQIILGFGILFLGMTVMTEAMRPLRDNPALIEFVTIMGKHRLLGVLAGIVMTVIVQSSSATVGILMAAASQGLLTFETALPILFGDNIGTCVTAVLASTGTSLSAKRTALVHVLFNVFGTILALIFLPVFSKFVAWITPFGGVSRLIANAHTSFNLLNTLVWLPMAGLLARMVVRLYPGEEKIVEHGTKYIDKRMLGTPSVAIQLSTKELVRMARIAQDMVNDAGLALLQSGSPENILKTIETHEDVVDDLQNEIIFYLSTLMAQGTLTHRQSTQVAGLLHVVNDIERVGDHAVNLGNFASYKWESRMEFSDEAKSELADLFKRVDAILSDALTALETNDPALAQDVWEKERIIDEIEADLRDNHFKRLNEGTCQPESAVIYIEVLDNLERLADHAVNLADAVVQNTVSQQE